MFAKQLPILLLLGCEAPNFNNADMGLNDGSRVDLIFQSLPDQLPTPDLGGILSVVVDAPVLMVNLSSEGVTDWAHWGLFGEVSMTQKDTAISLINPFVVIGSDKITSHQYINNAVKYQWDDGKPASTEAGTTDGVFVNGKDNGFRLTVAAGLVVHTLRLYISGYASDFKIAAHMSDGSALDTESVVINNKMDSVYKAYTFTFRANSNNQLLVIEWFVIKENWGGANVTLQAATIW